MSPWYRIAMCAAWGLCSGVVFTEDRVSIGVTLMGVLLLNALWDIADRCER